MATFKEIQQEVERYKGTLVIVGFRVVLLMGVVDGGDDYYYQICENVSMGQDKHLLHSCVMGFVPIKDKIDATEYQRMVHIWNLNSATKSE